MCPDSRCKTGKDSEAIFVGSHTKGWRDSGRRRKEGDSRELAYDDKVMDVVLSRKENICFSKAPSIKNMMKFYNKKYLPFDRSWMWCYQGKRCLLRGLMKRLKEEHTG